MLLPPETTPAAVKGLFCLGTWAQEQLQQNWGRGSGGTGNKGVSTYVTEWESCEYYTEEMRKEVKERSHIQQEESSFVGEEDGFCPPGRSAGLVCCDMA